MHKSDYNSFMFWKLNGLLVIPHELLHVGAHRLIGKRCQYRLGESFVKPLEPCTVGQQLFCLLFPLLVSFPVAFLPLGIWIITFIQFSYSTTTYLATAPVWHQSLFVLWFVLFTYVMSACLFDVLLAIRLLLKKLTHQPPNHTGKH